MPDKTRMQSFEYSSAETLSLEPPTYRPPPQLLLVPDPENRILEKPVLDRVAVNHGAVAHVDVQHPVFCIRPYHGKIAVGNDVLFPNGIVGWIERYENVDILIEARARLPEVPLVRRRIVGRGQALGNRMFAVIDG